MDRIRQDKSRQDRQDKARQDRQDKARQTKKETVKFQQTQSDVKMSD